MKKYLKEISLIFKSKLFYIVLLVGLILNAGFAYSSLWYKYDDFTNEKIPYYSYELQNERTELANGETIAKSVGKTGFLTEDDVKSFETKNGTILKDAITIEILQNAEYYTLLGNGKLVYNKNLIFKTPLTAEQYVSYLGTEKRLEDEYISEESMIVQQKFKELYNSSEKKSFYDIISRKNPKTSVYTDTYYDDLKFILRVYKDLLNSFENNQFYAEKQELFETLISEAEANGNINQAAVLKTELTGLKNAQTLDNYVDFKTTINQKAGEFFVTYKGDIFVLMAIILAVAFIINSKNKKDKMYPLIKSTPKGVMVHSLTRLVTISVMSAFCVVIFLIERVIISAIRYQTFDITVPYGIFSGFSGNWFSLSPTFVYLILAFVFMTIALTIIGMLASCISVVFNRFLYTELVSILFILPLYIFYANLSYHNSALFAKIINPFIIFDFDYFINNNLTVSIFNIVIPVPVFLFVIGLIIIGALFFVFKYFFKTIKNLTYYPISFMRSYAKNDYFSSMNKQNFLTKAFSKTNVALVLISIISIMASTWVYSSFVFERPNYVKDTMYTKYSGTLSEYKLSTIEKDYARFMDQKAANPLEQEILDKNKQEFGEFVDYAKNTYSNFADNHNADNAVIINQEKFTNLFAPSLINIVLILILILGISAIYSQNNNKTMIMLYHSMGVKKHKITRLKLINVGIFVVFVYLVYLITHIICNFAVFNDLNASITNIVSLQNLSQTMSLNSFIIISNLFLFVGLIIISLVIFLINVLSKSFKKGFLISCGIILAPAILSGLQMPFINSFSFNMFAKPDVLISLGQKISLLPLLVLIGFIIILALCFVANLPAKHSLASTLRLNSIFTFMKGVGNNMIKLGFSKNKSSTKMLGDNLFEDKDFSPSEDKVVFDFCPTLLFSDKESFEKWSDCCSNYANYIHDIGYTGVVNYILRMNTSDIMVKKFYLYPPKDKQSVVLRRDITEFFASNPQVIKKVVDLIDKLKLYNNKYKLMETITNNSQRQLFFANLCVCLIEIINELKSIFSVSPLFKNFINELDRYSDFISIKEIVSLSDDILNDIKSIGNFNLKGNSKTNIVKFEYGEMGSDPFAQRLADEISFFTNVNLNTHFSGVTSQNITALEKIFINYIKKEKPALFDKLNNFFAKFYPFPAQTSLDICDQLIYYTSFINFNNELIKNNIKTCPASFKGREINVSNCYDVALCIKVLKGEINREDIVRNDIDLNDKDRFFVLTGPNQGGKTTYLRTVTLAVLFAQNGFFIPCDGAFVPFIDNIFTHFDQGEKISTDGGRLQGEIKMIKNILSAATENSLVIMNETFSSTRRSDACELAKVITDMFLERGCYCGYATHFYEIYDSICNKDGSFSLAADFVDIGGHLTPTYKVVRKLPAGSSLANEIAEKCKMTYENILALIMPKKEGEFDV